MLWAIALRNRIPVPVDSPRCVPVDEGITYVVPSLLVFCCFFIVFFFFSFLLFLFPQNCLLDEDLRQTERTLPLLPTVFKLQLVDPLTPFQNVSGADQTAFSSQTFINCHKGNSSYQTGGSIRSFGYRRI